jgi:hypothetical protein
LFAAFRKFTQYRRQRTVLSKQARQKARADFLRKVFCGLQCITQKRVRLRELEHTLLAKARQKLGLKHLRLWQHALHTEYLIETHTRSALLQKGFTGLRRRLDYRYLQMQLH